MSNLKLVILVSAILSIVIRVTITHFISCPPDTNTVLSVRLNCEWYIRCIKGHAIVIRCRKGKYFDRFASGGPKCVRATSFNCPKIVKQRCPSSTLGEAPKICKYGPVGSECRKYIQCVEYAPQWPDLSYCKMRYCPPTRQWNNITKYCDSPANINPVYGCS